MGKVSSLALLLLLDFLTRLCCCTTSDNARQRLQNIVVEDARLLNPKLVALRAQAVEEKVERTQPCIEGLAGAGTDAIQALLFFAGALGLRAPVVFSR